jgi:polyhydroxyalkanoate synthesis regulator phasin
VDKLSAHEKGKINTKNYKAYVDNLFATGQKFPINQFGNVNIEKVAESCGFLRGVINRKGSKYAAQLDIDVKRIGTQLSEGTYEPSKLVEKASEKSQEASRLQKELDARSQEINLLRGQVEILSLRVRELEQKHDEKSLAIEEMLSSGRRFEL